MTDYARLLNGEQLAAVTAADGPLLVLAAAGTGKTRTLVYRLAYLVESGESAENIILLTFTNRAASEMLERAHQQVGSSVGNLMSGTFHHVCNRFLRRYAGLLKFPNDFVILDRDDSLALIDKCIKESIRDRKEFPKKDVIASMIGRAANSQLMIEDILEESLKKFSCDPHDIVRVARLYGERKVDLRAMDFDDLLVNGLRLLEEHREVREQYQERFRHVLVDEYQDTNLLQAQMVDLLAAKHRNIMAVGDDFQCIYSWRGANFKNILEFPKRWPDCQIVKLEQNYRSVPEVLEVANACIKGNPEQFQKTLRATRDKRKRPEVFFLRDDNEQSRMVTEMIHHYRSLGYKLRDMAILYRAHFHSIDLQITLSRMHLPFAITSGISVFQQAHVKDVLAFLRFCIGSVDAISFERLLGLLPGVGPKTVEKMWQSLGCSFDVRVSEQREQLLALLRPSARQQWQPVDALFGEFDKLRGSSTEREIIDRFCEVFYKSHLARVYDDSERREEDVIELAVQVAKSEGGIAGFLQEVALLTNVDHQHDKLAREQEDKLLLSTVHQAKGLEWPVVFIIWASEGMFPSSRSMGEQEDDAEERRLFYVAVTRAKDELVLSAPERRFSRDGGVFFCRPSRFIKEIPRKLYRESYGWHG